MVRGDSQEPGAKLGFFAKLAQVLDHAQKRLLGDLLGILVLLDDPACNAVHLPLIFDQQRFHGREIPALACSTSERSASILPFHCSRSSGPIAGEASAATRTAPRPVEPDRLPDIVDHDLARIAAFQVLLERFANARVQLAVHVLVHAASNSSHFIVVLAGRAAVVCRLGAATILSLAR